MSTDKKTKTVIAKVNITSDFSNWWEIDLSAVVSVPKENIISAVIEHGGLYLIYHYQQEIETNDQR